MAVVAFALPILPGQEEVVRRMGEAVSGSEELREGYEESRRVWELARRRCGSRERP
jgi:hypothetical protein